MKYLLLTLIAICSLVPIVAYSVDSVSPITVNLVDKRLSREEVVAAFQQRDQAIAVLTQAIKELQSEKTTD